MGETSREATVEPMSDGLPTLATGEPVLHRWFVIAMLGLAPIALGVSAWAFLSIPEGSVSPAERRPVGDATVTIDRGEAVLAESDDVEAGPACMEDIALVGDSGSRAAARRAAAATCQLIASGAFAEAAGGLEVWVAHGGVLRMATFERSGVESSARIEAGTMVIELNAKFLYEDATRAAPALVHQLVLVADDRWPGQPVHVDTELAATQAQHEACRRLSFGGEPPRGCIDVAELLESDDPRHDLIDAGFPAS